MAGWTSTINPPPKLNLDYTKPKKTEPETPVTAPPYGYPYGTPTPGAYGPGPYGPPHMYPPISPFGYRHSLGLHYSRHDEMPSSDGLEPMEDVSLFPLLQQWLTELDNGRVSTITTLHHSPRTLFERNTCEYAISRC